MQDMQPDNTNMMPQGETDREGAMAKADLYKLANYSLKLFKRMEDEDQLEGWVQAKITKAADYIASVYHYLEYEMKISEYGSHLETAEMYSESQKAAIKGKLMEAKEKVAQLKKLQADKKQKEEGSKSSVKEGVISGGEESCTECGGTGMIYREATPVPDHVKGKVEKYKRQTKAFHAASKRIDANKNGIPDDEEVSEEQGELKKTGDSKKTPTGRLTKTDTGVIHKNTSYKDDGEADDKSGKGKKSHAKAQSAAEKQDRAPKQKQSPKSAKTWGMKDSEKFDNRDKAVDETYGQGVYAEGKKPDFLDMDKDGDKKEPMKKAVADKKKNPFAKKVSEGQATAPSVYGPALRAAEKLKYDNPDPKFDAALKRIEADYGQKSRDIGLANAMGKPQSGNQELQKQIDLRFKSDLESLVSDQQRKLGLRENQVMSPPDGATAPPPKGKDGQYPVITSGPNKGKRWTAEKPGPTNPAFKEGAKSELKGGQKKLDVDKDGKLEKSDFAKLRASKNVEEGSTGDYSAKKAAAGKDIGKPGKMFSKIAKKAEAGGAKSGEAVAGAVLKKLRAKESVQETALDAWKRKAQKLKESMTSSQLNEEDSNAKALQGLIAFAMKTDEENALAAMKQGDQAFTAYLQALLAKGDVKPDQATLDQAMEKAQSSDGEETADTATAEKDSAAVVTESSDLSRMRQLMTRLNG